MRISQSFSSKTGFKSLNLCLRLLILRWHIIGLFKLPFLLSRSSLKISQGSSHSEFVDERFIFSAWMSKPGDCTGDKGWRLSSPEQDVSDDTLLSSKLELKKESVKFGSIHFLQYHDSSESDYLRYSSLLIDRHVR